MGMSGARKRSPLTRVLICAFVVATAVTATPAAADPARPGADFPPEVKALPAAAAGVVAAERDAVLGAGWQRSGDRAWTTSGDGAGFHVLAADARDGYTWRTVTTLAEPGFEADQWIGNACVTGSGARLAVTYAPRTFTNEPDLFERGGFSAIVDLATGAVTKLPVRTTLAHYSPACGIGETVLLTQAGAEDKGRTRLVAVDAATGVGRPPITLDGQITSAVPVGDGIVAADVARLVRIDPAGKRTPVVATSSIPFRLVPDADGGVVFLDHDGTTGFVRRVDAETVGKGAAQAPAVVSGPLTALDLVGAAGRAYVTGKPDRTGSLPRTVRQVNAPKGAQVSTRGEAVLTKVLSAGVRTPGSEATAPRQVDITLLATGTGRSVDLSVVPGDNTSDSKGAGVAPRASGTAGKATAGSPTVPWEDERTCSVPRNDPANQVMQPKPRQVEWAADQAVRSALTVQRPANWKNLTMPAYTPQGLFPPVTLDGGGYIPAQVMLGVLSQESNLWQASPTALPGDTGNPRIGNFYGREIYNQDQSDDWAIRWEQADCGYGVTQLTDGMRMAGKEKPHETAYPYQTQRAIALDFAANVAVGRQLLAKKWNETRQAGLVVNDGNPQYLENWFFAVWAYNSGFHPQGEAAQHNGAWGVGWLNNPVNPHYPPNRGPFLEASMADAAHPQDWPYPEKVMGFAGHPIDLLESPGTYVAAFRPAWWPGTATTAPLNRAMVKPPTTKFCDNTNNCEPGTLHAPTDPDVVGEPAGPCAHTNSVGQYDLKCWYHRPAAWKSNCVDTCGHELLRFDPGWVYQEDGTSFPPNCDLAGLPANALVVDDMSDTTPSVRPNCPHPGHNAGDFRLTFTADDTGHYPSKVDFHQLGGGFGAHFWMAHTRTPDRDGGTLRVTGTWDPDASLTGWTRIKVHIPDHGAWTRQADYVVNLGNGKTRHRVVNQAWRTNKWVDLGVFPLAGDASLALTTDTPDGVKGEDSVAFDAAAFIPTSKPTASYVALGDSYSSGEGVEPYDHNSDFTPDAGRVDACHRSTSGAYPRMVTLPGHSKPIAQEAEEGTASFAFLACSGAMTTSVTQDAVSAEPSDDDIRGSTVWGRADWAYGELTQVDQGWLDEDTTHVTLSIGGNDLRFTDVLTGCVVTVQRCYGPAERLTRWSNKVVDPKPLRDYEEEIIRDELRKHLTATYWSIKRKAPNAKVIVLGYPQLFEDVPVLGCDGLTAETRDFLNWFGNLLTATIATTVAPMRADGANIQFVDPTPSWRLGKHWACESVPWTNRLVLLTDSGSGRKWVGPGSFHPNLAGHQNLATLVNSALRGTSTQSAVASRISTYVRGRGWTITDAQAQDAARQCLKLTADGGLVDDPCMTLPTFYPTTSDAAGAAENDYQSLRGNPVWVRLHYVRGTEPNSEKGKVLDRDWMNRVGVQTYCPVPRGTNLLQCDEYPFYSSEMGGAWAWDGDQDSPVSTRLRMIDSGENGREGTMLGAMYRKTECAIQTGTYDAVTREPVTFGSPYLTIPVLDGALTPATFYVC
jgi:hypothetical protein